MNTEKPTEIEDTLDYLQFECSLSNYSLNAHFFNSASVLLNFLTANVPII